jgi:small subunit ribosomal protein S9
LIEREEQEQGEPAEVTPEPDPQQTEAAGADEAPAAEPAAADEAPAPAADEVAPQAEAEAPAEAAEPEPTEPESADPEGTAPESAELDAAPVEEAPAEAPSRTLEELAADARYYATGKRKTAVARVIIRPGTGQFEFNGRSLEVYFPRRVHQAVVRQPLEIVGFADRVDVRARIHGGGISGQADAVRHGIAKALIEADPALRGELKRRQLLTRDPREKERRKAGLKKARKRPQFSKR